MQARVDLPPGLRLEPDAEALMFRTAQEALRNVHGATVTRTTST